MPGPREWSPKEEPAEKTFEFVGLKMDVKRTGKRGWGPEEELYQTIVTAPDGMKFRHTNSLSTMARYDGTGLLESAMSALIEIDLVKTDPAHFKEMLEGFFLFSHHKASRITSGARFAAQSFDLDQLIEATNLVNRELNKIPKVQRAAKRGWEALMKRRGQPPS